MTWNPEIETDDVTEDELEELAGSYSACNDFAWAYAAEHDDVEVRVGETVTGGIHCYVYDAAQDVTVDATLGQFDGLPTAAAWDGDRHPHIAEEWETWEDKEAFVEHYDRAHSPFMV